MSSTSDETEDMIRAESGGSLILPERNLVMRGLIHIYTGDGKGKTTAAVGLGVRACGQGMRVLMVQFLKSMPTGEMYSLKKLEPGFVLYRGTDTKKFTWQMNDEEKSQAAAQQRAIFHHAVSAAVNGECDMLIMDEVMGALSSGMIDMESLLRFISAKPEKLELILTGRDAPAELIGVTDYVSEIRAVKHPAQKGISARKGVEY
jgi:cob(I)alamin adenosyltransferase